jgi:hypothetical protein
MSIHGQVGGSADYSIAATVYAAPVASGLLGWWFLGALPGDDAATALARTVKNLAPTAHVLTPVNTPVISSGYVTVDGTHSLATTIPESVDFTLVIGAQPMAVSANIGGWHSGSSATILNNQAGALGTLAGFSPHDVAGVISQVSAGSIVVSPYASLKMLSWSIAANAARLRNLTDAQVGTATITGTRTTSTPATGLLLGGHPLFPAAARVFFLAAYDRLLSDAEEDTIRTTVAAWRLAKHGDVV